MVREFDKKIASKPMYMTEKFSCSNFESTPWSKSVSLDGQKLCGVTFANFTLLVVKKLPISVFIKLVTGKILSTSHYKFVKFVNAQN